MHFSSSKKHKKQWVWAMSPSKHFWNETMFAFFVREWGRIIQNAQRIDKCCICKIWVHVNVKLGFKFLFKQKHGRAMRFTNLLNVPFVKVLLVPLFSLDSFLCCSRERVPFKHGVWRKLWNFLGCLLFIHLLQILMIIFIYILSIPIFNIKILALISTIPCPLTQHNHLGVESSMQPIYVILLSSTSNELPILFLDFCRCVLSPLVHHSFKKFSNKPQLELIILSTNLDGCTSKLPVRRVLCLPIELQMTCQSIIFNEPDLS
jgi:hypothetical protein